MGLLDRAISRGISRGVGNAIGKAVEQAVAPKAAELANKTAQRLDQATGNAQRQSSQPAQMPQTAFTGAFANLQRAAEGFANEAAKTMKLCPSCGKPAGADEKFCPDCGAQLPAETLAQGAVCPACGKQNGIGTKFCADCGTKLPAAVQEEQAAQTRDAAVLAQWGEKLSAFPGWRCGGSEYHLEQFDSAVMFSVRLPSAFAAQNAVKQYRELLQQNGFRPAGQYPDPCHLYKMVNGVCFHCDTEHCFDGDSDCPSIYFNAEEPSGGFNYVKPAPRKPASFMDLFK